MSQTAQATQSAGATPAATASTAITPTIAAAVQGGGNSSGTMTASTTFKSMNDLKARYPALYNMMMQGIATNIVQDMQTQSDHLVSVMQGNG